MEGEEDRAGDDDDESERALPGQPVLQNVSDEVLTEPALRPQLAREQVSILSNPSLVVHVRFDPEVLVAAVRGRAGRRVVGDVC